MIIIINLPILYYYILVNAELTTAPAIYKLKTDNKTKLYLLYFIYNI